MGKWDRTDWRKMTPEEIRASIVEQVEKKGREYLRNNPTLQSVKFPIFGYGLQVVIVERDDP